VNTDAVVFVVDDDPSVRDALSNLIRSIGLQAQTFDSGRAFLSYERPDVAACLVLDVRLPGASGLDLQRELAAAGQQIPIIFITGHGDIPMTVRAMKAGAAEFLTKPFREQDLLDAIQQALAKDRRARERRAELSTIRIRHDTLTRREREVMALMVRGLLHKQIAAELGISMITSKVHRRNVMHKMAAGSLPELVRMTAKLAAG
jgi:FixJ family two-component response regulator